MGGGHPKENSIRLGRALGAGFAALTFGVLVAACDDNREAADTRPESGRAKAPDGSAKPEPRQQAEKPDTPRPPPAQPPSTSPGAAPSNARMIGTWSVMESPSGARTGDKAEGTTYRFEDGGKVTVAGAKQCAYVMEAAELKIDCGGALMTGKVEFRDNETMLWTVAENERITLKKR